MATIREDDCSFAESGKGIKALVTLYIGDRFMALFRLRNARNDAIVNYGEYDRGEKLNRMMDELLQEMKYAGVPYHPAMEAEMIKSVWKPTIRLSKSAVILRAGGETGDCSLTCSRRSHFTFCKAVRGCVNFTRCLYAAQYCITCHVW